MPARVTTAPVSGAMPRSSRLSLSATTSMLPSPLPTPTPLPPPPPPPPVGPVYTPGAQKASPRALRPNLAAVPIPSTAPAAPPPASVTTAPSDGPRRGSVGVPLSMRRTRDPPLPLAGPASRTNSVYAPLLLLLLPAVYVSVLMARARGRAKDAERALTALSLPPSVQGAPEAAAWLAAHRPATVVSRTLCTPPSQMTPSSNSARMALLPRSATKAAPVSSAPCPPSWGSTAME